jgi:flagellar assembly protein FliH
MKPSSTEVNRHRPVPVSSGQVAASAQAVRFDRQLSGAGGLGWGDPQVERMLAEAAGAAREEGRAAGYAAGWAQGRQAVAQQLAEEAADRAATDQALRRATSVRAQALLAALGDAGRQVQEAVRTSLRVLGDRTGIVLHVHPDDLALVSGTGSITTSGATGSMGAATAGPAVPPGVTLVTDAAVPPGSVVARTPLHRLPVDFAAAIHAAEEVLRS